jgi:hypothetical protein
VIALLESLTGAAPSVGFVHGMLARTAGLLGVVHDRIRALIVAAHAVCCDETPLKIGPRTPRPGTKKAERSLAMFTNSVLTELGARPDGCAIIVHDRYQNYDSPALGTLAYNCAPSTYSVISPGPRSSTPTPSGPARSPMRCAN